MAGSRRCLLDYRAQLFHHLLHFIFPFAFRHNADQRFCSRGAHQQPPGTIQALLRLNDGGLHTGTDSDPVTDTDTVTAGAIASPTASFVGSALQSMVSTPSGVEKGPKDDAPAGEAGVLRGAGGPDPGSIARLYLTDVPLGPMRLVHDTGLFMTNFEEKYEAVAQPTYEISLRLMRDGPLRQS